MLTITHILYAGKCKCSGKWLGVDCAIDGSIAPHMLPSVDNAMCNPSESLCNTVTVLGERFVWSVKLACHVQEIQVSEKYCHLYVVSDI